MSGLFVNDGFTLRHTVAARGPVPELQIKYRPALPIEVYQWREDREAARKPAKRLQIDLAFLAKHLVWWDIKEPLTVETLENIWPQIISELLDLVAGYQVGEQIESEKN